jgi:hypothetical protein
MSLRNFPWLTNTHLRAKIVTNWLNNQTCLVIKLALLLPAASANASLPTPSTLVHSWLGISSDLKANFKSYSLQGTFVHAAFMGKTLQDNYSWSVKHSGNQLHWTFDRTSSYESSSHRAIAFNGKDWYSLWAPQKIGVETQGQVWQNPAGKLGNLDDQAGFWPFDVGQMINQPVRLLPANLPAEYESRLGNLRVSGPLVVEGKTCFLLSCTTARNESIVLPKNVYFIERGNRFVPWRYDVDVEGAKLSFTYGEYRDIGGVPLPISWKSDGQALVNGRWKALVADTGRYILTLNPIFTKGDFVITYPKGIGIYHQDTGLIEKAPPKSGSLPMVAKIAIAIAAALCVVVALLFRKSNK